jgi:hypothetical protein
MDYQTAVKTAEEAVGAMKDPKLREIAFAQVLAKLLGRDKEPPARPAQGSKGDGATKAGESSGKKASGVTAWLRELISEGFFATPRHVQTILQELEERGHHLKPQDITKQLGLLCVAKELRRKKLPPTGGKAPVWHYSNW